ncbi:MAG: hypothetical protein R6W78_10305 [Bacteroidales bacterium]
MSSKKHPKIKNQPVAKQNQHTRKADHDASTDQPMQEKGFRASVDRFFQKRLNLFFILSLVLTVILSVYLFDVKVHEGGDDSNYIQMAHRFINGKSFPTFHGEFYSIFLALPILFFGVNVVILKIISLFLMIGHLVFFFLAFKNRVTSTMLVFTMLIISVSANILFFASQTYSEALYMFIQSLSFFIAFKLIDKIITNKINYVDYWPLWISTGLLIFLLSITRNIGMAILLAIGAYFLFNKKFYAIIYLAASYLIFNFGFGLYKRLVWSIDQSTVAQQSSLIMLKDPYNAAKGVEDFSGMVERFLANIKIYLSRHFFASIGLRDPSKIETTYLPSIILIVIFLVALYFAFKKHKPMLLTGLYLGIAVATTFITLNQSWGQLRMIVIFIPMILLFLAFGIEELSKMKNFRFLYPVLLLLFILIFFRCLGQSVKKASINQKVLSKNIEGNMYYGFTPDWINFLKLSEWTGKNLPKEALVASRKPSISFIYSKGKEFYGIFRIPQEEGDIVINRIKSAGGHTCVFNISDLSAKGLPAMPQIQARQSIDALIGQSNLIYGICQSDGTECIELGNTLKGYGIPVYEIDTLQNMLNNANMPTYGIVPDSLLNNLRKNNVEYVIMASLRMNPNMKTENIVNTIHRYLMYIEIKYFNLFTIVQQFGKEEEEPAKLIKINYEVLNR